MEAIVRTQVSIQKHRELMGQLDLLHTGAKDHLDYPEVVQLMARLQGKLQEVQVMDNHLEIKYHTPKALLELASLTLKEHL